MNKNFNEWYIDICNQPKEGQLEKRWDSIEKFSDGVTANDIINLVKLFFNIPVDEEFRSNFAEVFIKNDLSFSKKYNKELALLAGATLIEIANNYEEYDGFVELITLAASFGGRTPVVQDIFIEIKKLFANDAFSIRETNCKKVGQIQLPTSDLLVKSLADDWSDETSKNLIDYVKKIDASFSQITKSQEIYFEDSQLLWWLMSGWSRDLNCSYKDIDKQSACFIIGKEAAELVNVFPGPYSIKGVLNKILESCKGRNTNLKFTDIIYNADNSWKTKYVKKYNNSKIVELLPVTSAFIRSENTTTKEEWISKYTQEIHASVEEMKCSSLDYAMQIYLEVLVQRCYCKLQDK